MTVLAVFEEFRFIWELLAGSFLFLLPFAEKKPRFMLRVSLGTALLTVLSLIRFPLMDLFSDTSRVVISAAVASDYLLLIFGAMVLFLQCFRLTLSDALYFTVAGYAAQHLVYALIHELLARQLWPGLTGYLGLYMLVCIGACALLFIPIYIIFSPPLRQCGGVMFEDVPSAVFANLLLLALTMVCTFTCQHVFEFWEASRETGAILSVLVCIMLLFIQYGTLRVVRGHQENTVIRQMLQDSAKNYERSKELMDYVNRSVHDLRHTLRSMEHMTAEERRQYISEAESNLTEYRRLTFSDNEVLNTILAEKALSCANRNIRLSCSVEGAIPKRLSVPDLYALLGNSIDNAIECTEQFEDPEQRVISLTIRSRMGFTCIQTNNYCSTPLQSSDGLPVTTKEDRLRHGYGLKSIRYLSRKYGGDMTVRLQDGVFILQVTIPE